MSNKTKAVISSITLALTLYAVVTGAIGGLNALVLIALISFTTLGYWYHDRL